MVINDIPYDEQLIKEGKKKYLIILWIRLLKKRKDQLL